MRTRVVAGASIFVLALAASGGAEEPQAEARKGAEALVAEQLVHETVRPPTPEMVALEAKQAVRKMSDEQVEALLDGEALAELLPWRDEELALERDELRLAAAKALGNPESELVFVPLPPCRVIDTRLGGGMLAPGVTRHFEIAGSANFAAQGGNASGCGVPLGATTPVAAAVFINVVAVGPTGPGHLTGWEFGQPPPNAAILSFSDVPGLNIANGVILPIAGVATSDKDLSIVAGVSSAFVVADVTGYFTRFPIEQLQGQIQSTVTTNSITTLVDLADGGCKQLNTCTVTTNGTGTVLVEAWAQVVVNHQGPPSGTLDRSVMQVETTDPVTCPQDDSVDTSDYEIPEALGTNDDVDFTLSHGRTFSQATGVTRTYRLSGRMVNGATSLDTVENSHMICTFIPD
jgi:hypothetical protein